MGVRGISHYSCRVYKSHCIMNKSDYQTYLVTIRFFGGAEMSGRLDFILYSLIFS